jgi:predicted DNA-binding WGR domain protein
MHNSNPSTMAGYDQRGHDDTDADLSPSHLGNGGFSQGLRLERIDPARNMARYYTLVVELTLFEDWSCTRNFGRIGSRGGRIMLGLFETQAAAEAELMALLRQKQARGYRIIAT